MNARLNIVFYRRLYETEGVITLRKFLLKIPSASVTSIATMSFSMFDVACILADWF